MKSCNCGVYVAAVLDVIKGVLRDDCILAKEPLLFYSNLFP